MTNKSFAPSNRAQLINSFTKKMVGKTVLVSRGDREYPAEVLGTRNENELIIRRFSPNSREECVNLFDIRSL
jgi:hypothetical protein